VFRNGHYGVFSEDTDDGEAYLVHRSGWITYRAAQGHTPVLDAIVIDNRDKWGEITHGRSYLAFDGFAVGGVSLQYTSHVRISNCTIHKSPVSVSGYYEPYFAPSNVCVYAKYANDVTISECDISRGYRGLTVLSCNNWSIANNTIHHLSEDGMSLPGSDNVTIESNLIYDLRRFTTTMDVRGSKTGTFVPGEVVTMPGTNAVGIVHDDRGSYVRVYATSETTFYSSWWADKDRYLVGQTSGATVNPISDVDPPHGDLIQVDTHEAITGWVLRNNILDRRRSGGVGTENGQGIKLKSSHADGISCTIENNIIDAGQTFADTQGLRNAIINNNTFLGTGGFEIRSGGNSSTIAELHNNIIQRISLFTWETHGVTVLSHGNNIFNIEPTGLTMNASEVLLASDAAFGALFAGYAASPRDLTLSAGSRAIDFGDAAHGPSTDILGHTRTGSPDAGCYEFYGLVLAAIGDRSVDQGEVLTITVSATDSDGKPITYSASGEPFDLGATFSGQTFRWDTSDAQAGTYAVTFVASNGEKQDRETIGISVLGENHVPVLSSVGNKSTTEGVRLGFSLSGSDPDGDALEYLADGLPSGATLSSTTGAFSWTPAGGQAGSYAVTFTVSDGRATDSETITIAVEAVAGGNSAPVLAAIGNKSVNEAASLAFSISATDADGDRITYSANNLPGGANFAGRTFSWVPTTAQIGSHQITFVASDGEAQDSETITVNVVSIGLDKAAPVVTGRSPEPDAIQVTLNHLVTLHVTDAGRGVDADSVVIRVNDQTIYQGDTNAYTSGSGRCSRSGSKSDYRFVYQPNELFDFDEEVTVKVNAADLEGNVMSQNAYSFVTEMRAFGNNWPVGSDVAAGKGKPTTAGNAHGDIWAAWHAGAAGARDIYVSRLSAGEDAFGGAARLTTSLQDQCNPDMAAGSDGSMYIVWQDNSRGNWDIYLSISADGTTWSRPVQVTDSDDNEINPAVIVDDQSPHRAYIAWQDDRNGHYDIYVASSASAFVNDTVSRVTTHGTAQIDPDLAVDGQNNVYVVWTDMRNGQANLYGASSNNGPWTNVPVVTASGSQTDAAIAIAPGGSTLHIVWADDRPGKSDIYYARSQGLPASPVSGSTIIDDTSRAKQLAPALACAGNDQAFACWQDFRHAAGGTDSDLFMAELRSGSARTNVFVGDDGTNANQSQPAVGIDRYGNPYVVWTDDRDAMDEVYYAATTVISPLPLDSKVVTVTGATVGPDPQNIDEPQDVSIIVPAGACPSDTRITIAEILNPQALPVECLGSYDFGPSGVEFDEPATLTIPYRYAGTGGSAVPYWYDALTGALSQQGITEIENLDISPELNALRFKTTHFTPFYLVVSDAGTDTAAGGGGGGGGGCSVSATGDGAPQELVIPYAVVALVMFVLRHRDKKRRDSATAGD
jgi:hypothetical protein